MSHNLAEEMQLQAPGERALLAPDEPRPFRVLNPDGRGLPLLLVCDHASNFVPRALANLGLERPDLERHIAFDIGIEGVAERLSALLDVPLVITHFSRLICDPNRPPDDPTIAPAISDGTLIPGNRDLAPEALEERLATFYRPYHAAISGALDGLLAEGLRPALISLHSMTPMLRGERRPWETSILWNDDPRLPLPMIARLRGLGLTVGDNQPYAGNDGHGNTVHFHAEPRGLANILFEIRQDLIDTPKGQEDWAVLLAEELSAMIPTIDFSEDWNRERERGGTELHRRD
jgi:predicted N-formylglutamate amidohydrolase